MISTSSTISGPFTATVRDCSRHQRRVIFDPFNEPFDLEEQDANRFTGVTSYRAAASGRAAR